MRALDPEDLTGLGVSALGLEHIEAAFAVEDGRRLLLLVATEDCPYEERVGIYVVKIADSRPARILDSAWIGAALTPGVVRSVEVVGATCISFEFVRPEPWRVEVLPTMKLRPFRAVAGVGRPLGLRTMLTIR